MKTVNLFSVDRLAEPTPPACVAVPLLAVAVLIGAAAIINHLSGVFA